MSRIGRKAITLPSGVTVEVKANEVIVKGPKGQLTSPLFENITVTVADGEVIVGRTAEDGQVKAYHGLVRSLVNNNITGVQGDYKKTLKLVGTGYRATQKGKDINLSLGFSHPVIFEAPAGITLKVEGTDTIYVTGIDKQAVGQVAANIRKIKPPEPYKGKGIRYEDEVVRRKQGKAAAK